MIHHSERQLPCFILPSTETVNEFVGSMLPDFSSSVASVHPLVPSSMLFNQLSPSVDVPPFPPSASLSFNSVTNISTSPSMITGISESFSASSKFPAVSCATAQNCDQYQQLYRLIQSFLPEKLIQESINMKLTTQSTNNSITTATKVSQNESEDGLFLPTCDSLYTKSSDIQHHENARIMQHNLCGVSATTLLNEIPTSGSVRTLTSTNSNSTSSSTSFEENCLNSKWLRTQFSRLSTAASLTQQDSFVTGSPLHQSLLSTSPLTPPNISFDSYKATSMADGSLSYAEPSAIYKAASSDDFSLVQPDHTVDDLTSLASTTEWIQSLRTSVGEFCRSPRGILIILDFDCTLWPTSEHESKGWTSPGDIDIQLLTLLDKEVAHLLLTASSIGHAVGRRLCNCSVSITQTPSRGDFHLKDSLKQIIHNKDEDWPPCSVQECFAGTAGLHTLGVPSQQRDQYLQSIVTTKGFTRHVPSVTVKIITNACKEHVQDVIATYLNETHFLLSAFNGNIEVVSARDLYSKNLPFSERKLHAFRCALRDFSNQLCLKEDMMSGIGALRDRCPPFLQGIQVISIGDSEWERSAAFCLAEESNHLVDSVRSIKLLEEPTLRGSIIQVRFVAEQLVDWVCSPEPSLDLCIHVEESDTNQLKNSDSSFSTAVSEPSTLMFPSASNVPLGFLATNIESEGVDLCKGELPGLRSPLDVHFDSSPINIIQASSLSKDILGTPTSDLEKILGGSLAPRRISAIPANYNVIPIWKIAIIDLFRRAVDHLTVTMAAIVAECPRSTTIPQHVCECKSNLNTDTKEFCMLHLLLEVMPTLFQQLGRILCVVVNKEASNAESNNWLTIPLPSYTIHRNGLFHVRFQQSQLCCQFAEKEKSITLACEPISACPCGERFLVFKQIKLMQEYFSSLDISATTPMTGFAEITDRLSSLKYQPLDLGGYQCCPITTSKYFSAKDLVQCFYVGVTVVTDVVESLETIPLRQRARLAHWTWQLMVKVAAQLS